MGFFNNLFSKENTYESYELKKTLSDSLSLVNQLQILKRANVISSNDHSKTLRDSEMRYAALFDNIKRSRVGFKQDFSPLEFDESSKGLRKLGPFCDQLKLLNENLIELLKSFPENELILAGVIPLNHPGNYYFDIQAKGQNNSLNKNMFVQEMELLGIGDIPLAELVSGDNSLRAISRSVPKLKYLSMFAMEITDGLLNEMEIHKLQNLEYLDLSENKLTGLPNDFKQLKVLKYLSLRETAVDSLSVCLEMPNLVFLDLRNSGLEERKLFGI